MLYPKTNRLLPDQKGNFNSKIKLHGTNAHISLSDKGARVGSRSTPFFGCANGTHYGLETLVAEHKSYFTQLFETYGNLIILGEWCGKKIQKGVACSQIPERTFFVFAIYCGQYNFNPTAIADCLEKEGKPENIKILPYFKEYNLPDDFTKILEDVAAIDVCDPYIEQEYGIKGTGEGLVLFSETLFDADDFETVVFKLKGESHKKSAKITPVASPQT